MKSNMEEQLLFVSVMFLTAIVLVGTIVIVVGYYNYCCNLRYRIERANSDENLI